MVVTVASDEDISKLIEKKQMGQLRVMKMTVILQAKGMGNTSLTQPDHGIDKFAHQL